ncbi:MAG: hypothetical protein R3C61_18710 [Bacteroidia bacterium]
MKTSVKPFLSKLSRKDLLRLCNEKMVCAARDLAEFTKNGINASFIVALAHKCEDLEATIEQPFTVYNFQETQSTEREIKEAMSMICDMGRRIWSNNPSKYNDYLISISSSGLPESRANA